MLQSKYGIISIKLKLLTFLNSNIKNIINNIIIIKFNRANKILWYTKKTILQVVLKIRWIKYK